VKRIILVLFMGILSSLFGCKPQAAPPQTASAPKDMSAIDYAHESGGVFHHGTFTLIGSEVRATWTTTDAAGTKMTRDMQMTEETFRKLWDSLNSVPDFKAGIVRDPGTRIDPTTFHVVVIIFSFDGQKGMRTHMIPPDNASAAFREWLQTIGYSGK
jgi:hypothetical protein